jgi:chemotaxis response regulator CheB
MEINNMMDMLSFHGFYLLVFVLLVLISFFAYQVIMLHINNKNSQDTTHKLQLMYEKSTDSNVIMFNKATTTQKEIQLDTTEKMKKMTDNIINLPYTNIEAKETHEINVTLDEIKKSIKEIKKRLDLLEKKFK